MEVRTKELNGMKVESYELNEHDFETACTLLECGVMKDEHGELEDATPYLQEWIDNEYLDNGYREWLKKCIDSGAEIYTYNFGWQPISEIAVWDY